MRSVLVHLQAEEAAVLAFLDERFPAQRDPWVDFVEGDACLYIRLYRDHETEMEPEELHALRAHFGDAQPLSVIADVSGRHDGTEQVQRFARALLSRWRGVVQDEFTDHLWTLEELTSGATVDGMRFFDFLEHHRRRRSRREP